MRITFESTINKHVLIVVCNTCASVAAGFTGLFKHYQLREWPCGHSHWLLRRRVYTMLTHPHAHSFTHTLPLTHPLLLALRYFYTLTSVSHILSHFTPTRALARSFRHLAFEAALEKQTHTFSHRADTSELYLHCKEAPAEGF